jgi:hypothetical protein
MEGGACACERIRAGAGALQPLHGRSRIFASRSSTAPARSCFEDGRQRATSSTWRTWRRPSCLALESRRAAGHVYNIARASDRLGERGGAQPRGGDEPPRPSTEIAGKPGSATCATTFPDISKARGELGFAREGFLGGSASSPPGWPSAGGGPRRGSRQELERGASWHDRARRRRTRRPPRRRRPIPSPAARASSAPTSPTASPATGATC